jgi:hypothetical protein
MVSLFFSFVICMRTTQYLTSLSVVLVGMDVMLQLALMGTLFLLLITCTMFHL